MSSRRHLATAVALAVAATTVLSAPTGATATTSSATSAASGSPSSADLVEVTGTVRVLAGEGGQPDTYSVETRSGQSIRLAEGFEADPGSGFRGTLVVPRSGDAVAGTARRALLQRATTVPGGVKVRGVQVVTPRPSTAPSAHTTYLAKLTDLGPFTVSDAEIVAQVEGAQQYWVRESGGIIPAWTTATGLTPTTSGAASVAGGCGLGQGGAQFGAIARDVGSRLYPGVDFSGDSPNHLVIAVPGACYAAEAVGRANLGVSLNSGGPVIAVEQGGIEMRSTLEHEFGHNAGLEHSNNARAEYGGVYEVMGAGPADKNNPSLGTVYRWEEGLVQAGEHADATGGGSWALAPRSASTGLRSAVFIDPDTGRRHFVDLRDGSGTDANGCYSTPDYCNYATGKYGQNYRPGLVIERENEDRGSFVVDVQGGDGALQAGESWSNQSGSIVVTASTANTVTVARTPKPALPGGSASLSGKVQALGEVTAVGSVAGATAYRYQWVVDGQPVAQADDPTFTPTVAMAGKTLSVQAVGYAVGRDPSPASTSSSTKIAAATWYKQTGSTGEATISGKARVGEVLSASGLDWVNASGDKPAGYAATYRWLRNGKVIKGARKATYRLTRGDLKKRIQVKESPTAPGFDTDSFVRSDSTRKVRIGKLTSPRPTIGGKAKVGKRVVARTKGWTRGTKFRYSWFVNGKAVRGAHGKKLRITRAMKKKKLVVKVVGSKKGFRSASAKSRKTKVK